MINANFMPVFRNKKIAIKLFITFYFSRKCNFLIILACANNQKKYYTKMKNSFQYETLLIPFYTFSIYNNAFPH